MLEVPVHEFYLRDSKVYRVALGDLIPAAKRKTFRPLDPWNPERRNQTGSIGFMDVKVEDQLVPKVGAKPRPNPSRRMHSAGLYSLDDCEYTKALVINDIAIEPTHRKQGYATRLKQRAEELAREWELEAVVSPYLQSARMKRISKRLGYILYDGGRKAIKRLI